MAYPKNYRYTKEHEWINLDGKTAAVGITDYAQNSLGDIVFVELPKPGTEVTAGKSFGTVESVKSVSELYSPATGKVVAANDELTKVPEKVNSDPHGAWMIKLKLSNPAESANLLSAEDYLKKTGH